MYGEWLFESQKGTWSLEMVISRMEVFLGSNKKRVDVGLLEVCFR